MQTKQQLIIEAIQTKLAIREKLDRELFQLQEQLHDHEMENNPIYRAINSISQKISHSIYYGELDE